jgi:hypothetical protein
VLEFGSNVTKQLSDHGSYKCSVSGLFFTVHKLNPIFLTSQKGGLSILRAYERARPEVTSPFDSSISVAY